MKRIIFVTVFIFLFGYLVLLTILFPPNNAKFFSESDLNKKAEILNQEDSQIIPTLSFCELANNPEKYHDKIIRLKGKLALGLEGAWFDDSKCGADKAAIASFGSKEVWTKIEKARKMKNGKLSLDLNLIVIGKFKNLEYKDCCLIAPFQIEVFKIEEATNLD